MLDNAKFDLPLFTATNLKRLLHLTTGDLDVCTIAAMMADMQLQLRLKPTTATRPDFVGDPSLRPGSPTKSGRVADLSGLVADFSGFFGSQTWSVQSRHVRIFLSGRRQVWSGLVGSQ